MHAPQSATSKPGRSAFMGAIPSVISSVDTKRLAGLTSNAVMSDLRDCEKEALSHVASPLPNVSARDDCPSSGTSFNNRCTSYCPEADGPLSAPLRLQINRLQAVSPCFTSHASPRVGPHSQILTSIADDTAMSPALIGRIRLSELDHGELIDRSLPVCNCVTA